LIPKRRLGRINKKVSIITLGGCGVGLVPQEEADKVIESAFKHGVNMVDIAPTYGDSELRLAPWMKTHRNKIFLAEKTTQRTKKAAERELHQSLERLDVKSFDLSLTSISFMEWALWRKLIWCLVLMVLWRRLRRLRRLGL